MMHLSEYMWKILTHRIVNTALISTIYSYYHFNVPPMYFSLIR
jgi:hypothetical protein